MAKIVASFITEDNEFQQYQTADARQVAAREGLDLDVVFANTSPIQQIHQLFQYIQASGPQRPAAFIVEAVSDQGGIERVAAKAVEAGIGWVHINGGGPYLQALRLQHPSVPVSSVRIDQVEVGRIQGRQLLALLPSGGRVLYIQGPPMSAVVRDRLDGVRQAVGTRGIELLQVHAGSWTAAAAEEAVQQWCRFKDAAGSRLHAVSAQNDDMAQGARHVLLAHPDQARRDGWKQIPFTGIDGLPAGGRRMVDRGELAATVVGPSNGGPAIELIARFLRRAGQVPPELVQQPVSYPPVERLMPRRRPS